MSQIRAKIAQQEYLLTCPDGQEQLLQNAAQEVDAALSLARQAGQLRSREQMATWVALHAMLELHQLRAQIAQGLPPACADPAAQSAMEQAAQAASEQLAALQAQQARMAAQCEALMTRLDAALQPVQPHEEASPAVVDATVEVEVEAAAEDTPAYPASRAEVEAAVETQTETAPNEA